MTVKKDLLAAAKTVTAQNIGVGKFRIWGGGGGGRGVRFRILGGGGQIPSRHITS